MGLEALTPLLPLLWTGLAVPLIGLLIKWISAKINATQIGTNTAIDDYLLGKVQMAVANVGGRIVDAARAAMADGKIDDAEWSVIKSNAHEAALAELKALVPANYQDALKKALDSGALDAMIQFAVDLRKSAASATAKYETDTAAREVARYNAEHPK